MTCEPRNLNQSLREHTWNQSLQKQILVSRDDRSAHILYSSRSKDTVRIKASEGHFYQPFLCKANWTSCRILRCFVSLRLQCFMCTERLKSDLWCQEVGVRWCHIKIIHNSTQMHQIIENVWRRKFRCLCSDVGRKSQTWSTAQSVL